MKFETFNDFYPYYLGEHQNTTCRVLHFIGTSLVIAFIIYLMATAQPKLIWLIPLFGYSFAWVGHFFFEKNRPATFKHPLYSLMGDFVMFWQLLTGKIKF